MSLESIALYLNYQAASVMCWTYLFRTVGDVETGYWIRDGQLRRPEGITLTFTEKGLAWLRHSEPNVEDPGPLHLTPHQNWRFIHQRTTKWSIGVPKGTPFAIKEGLVTLDVEHMPAHTRFKFVEVPLNEPPKKPRGGKTIRSRRSFAVPAFGPQWAM